MDNPANPHRLPMEYWVYLPEMMIDMVISAALTTQVIRSNAGQGLLTYTAKPSDSKDLKRHHLGAVNHPSLPTIYKHQRNALKSLNTELSSPQAKYNDIVLSLVITLMRSEVRALFWRGRDLVVLIVLQIQQSAFGAWPVHLEAARTIIAHRGGFTALAEAGRGYLDFILSEFMLYVHISPVKYKRSLPFAYNPPESMS